MKEKKKLSAWKRLTILAIAILLIAGGICFRWYVFIKLPYIGYIDNFNFVVTDMGTEQYEKDVNGFKCEVHMPTLFSNNGFIAVRSGEFRVTVQPDGSLLHPEEPGISLFIWPSATKDVRYGLMIDSGAEVSEQSMIEVTNDNNNYIITHHFENQNIKDIYDKNETTIIEMLKSVDETWDFNGLDDISYGWKVKLANA